MSYAESALAKLAQEIARGAGSGRGEKYRPWLEAAGRRVPKSSYVYFVQLPLRRSNVHLMSRLEYHVALTVAYLQPLELREGLPAWPFAHDHPNKGWSPAIDAQLGRVPGLLEIARNVGIDHGHVIGAPTVPFVATTDLVVLFDETTPYGLIFVSVKPREILRERPRARERVALEAAYAASVKCRHWLATDEDVDRTLVSNLDWIRPKHSEMVEHRRSTQLSEFAAALQDALPTDPLGVCISNTQTKLRLEKPHAHLYFRLAVWCGLVDINPSQPIVMSRLATTGGHKLRSQLQAKLEGMQ